MAIELVEVRKNTRGVNSREIVYKAIGKYVEKTVARESKPVFNPDGTPKLDEKGNQVREPLGKDAEGKLITIEEKVLEFTSDGVLQADPGTGLADALELVNNDEQILLDCFADGFNERQYALEASKDELDEFLSTMEMNDEQKAVFKRTARQISRNYDTDILEAAEMVKGMMERAKAKAAAKAQPVAATA
jgi:hypothetical protein